MSKRGVSLLLILTATIALGALVQDYRFDTLIAAERANAGMLESDIHHLRDQLTTVQASQRAYVATGQSPTEWLGRVSTLMDQMGAAISRRRSVASDADAARLYDAAADELKQLKRIDGQVRTSLEQGDRLHASDLIFMDSAGLAPKIDESLAGAGTRDRQAIDRNVTKLATMRLAMNGIALLFALAVAIYFGRFVTVLGVRAKPSTAQMLRDLPPAVKPGTLMTPVTPPNGTSTLPAVHAAQAGASRPTNLTAAAELCVDLARVLDAGDVPALLERTASVLDARGIVLWAIDSDGALLRPSICHGYSDRIVRKLRPLQVDADNVTSLAYRSLQPQAMNGASVNDAGAIAIPLLTGTGCVGVMAAELRHNRPQADLLPIARILGAQFSTLITTPEDSARRTAQA